ncbi:MAG: HEAT repeat domain-containing protein [Candidatus Latescibacterota bacterium]|nr:MAG: HEAT repeat domain-containing protein [Candidatus Latescibacterota bacterium]
MISGTYNRPAGVDQADRVDLSPESLEKARTIFSALSKLVLGKKIYARNNPTLIKFANEFDVALHDFFINEEELVVAVDKFAIRWAGEVVYENDKRDESLAFLLYKDGMGEVSIQRSVTSQEMEAFVDLIKDEVRSTSQEEDIVTKFWKADFENISYRVLDEYLVGEFGDGSLGECESALSTLQHEDHPEIPSFEDKGRVIVGDGADLESIGYFLRDLVFRGKPPASADEEEDRFQDSMESIFGVSAGELRYTHEELINEKQTDGLVSFIGGYLDFTLMRDNSPAIRDVMNVIELLVEKMISELNAVVLGQTLAAIREFAANRMPPPNIESFCENLENKLTNTSVLISLGDIAGNADGDPKPVFEYYELVGPNALQPTLKLLEETDDARVHKMACDTLVATAGDQIQDVINGLNIDKPQIARDVIRLVKLTMPHHVPPVIKELIYYPDFQVRAEAIHFLAAFGDDDSALLLVRLLDDAERNTRLRAITEMSEMSHPIVKNRLEEVAFGKDIATRDLDEQIEIFRSLGKLGGSEVIPRLRQIVGRKPILFFGRKKKKGRKLLVVYALEQIADSDAVALLESLARDPDESVRAKAAQVLESLESSGQGPHKNKTGEKAPPIDSMSEETDGE